MGVRTDSETFPSLDISDSDGSDSEDTGIFSNKAIEVLSVKKPAEILIVLSETCEEDKVKEGDEIRIVGAPETGISDDKDNSDEPVKDDSDLHERDKGNIEKDKSEKDKPAEVKSVDLKSAEEKSAEEKSAEEKSAKLESTELDSVKLESAKDIKKSDEVDEGYFDSSYIDLEKILEKPNVDVSTSTLTTVTTTVTQLSHNCLRTVTKDLDLVDILNRDFQSKLCLTTGVQTDKVEGEPKRRKVSKACQITDEAVNTLNKKLLNLRNKLNKVIVEKDSVVEKNSRLEGKCSGLNTER